MVEKPLASTTFCGRPASFPDPSNGCPEKMTVAARPRAASHAKASWLAENAASFLRKVGASRILGPGWESCG